MSAHLLSTKIFFHTFQLDFFLVFTYPKLLFCYIPITVTVDQYNRIDYKKIYKCMCVCIFILFLHARNVLLKHNLYIVKSGNIGCRQVSKSAFKENVLLEKKNMKRIKFLRNKRCTHKNLQ